MLKIKELYSITSHFIFLLLYSVYSLKIILKKLAKRYLPAEIIDRPKMGFGFPMARWFKGPLAEFVEQIFRHGYIFQANLFEKQYIQTLLVEHKNGKVDHNFRIWFLLNLEIWYQIFILRFSKKRVRNWIAGFLPDYRTKGNKTFFV